MCKRREPWLLCLLIVFVLSQGGALAQAQTVKITPLGQRTGELCAADRALLFEDPTGVRILYDPGTTIAGGTDGRLGDVHVILVSHFHGDHIGVQKITQNPDDPKASCLTPNTTLVPNTNTAEIAAAKNSAVLVEYNLPALLSLRIATIRGVPTPNCPRAGLYNEMIVPRSEPCVAPLPFGARRTIKRSEAAPGVRIATVHAQHNDGFFQNNLITEPLGTYLRENGFVWTGGVAVGYVLTFTNGLKVYLSGDTGHTSDMKTIVHDYYRVNLAVVNVDGVNVMGPEEAAFAVRELIQAKAVIPSHVIEAATTGGQVNPGTVTARFIELMEGIPVYVPLSGVTMEFDGEAHCIAGCAPKTVEGKINKR